MPLYKYIAKFQPNKTIQGQLEANTEQEAISILTKMGYFPIEVKSVVITAKGRFVNTRPIRHKDVIIFTRQLSTLISSGVQIINAIEIIAGQSRLKPILEDINRRIRDGKSLSESLAFHPTLFSNLYISMINAGERGGNLTEVLTRLADFLERQREFRDSLRSALIYPSFIFVVGILTVMVLLGFVIPRLRVMFEDIGQILPLPTRMVIAVSGFFSRWWWLLGAVAFLLIFLLKRTSSTKQGKVFWDRFKIRLPILGDILFKSEISLMMRTLSLLLSSGITMVSSLDISNSVIRNQFISGQIKDFKAKISDGRSLSACLKDSGIFSELVVNIINTGEESGRLDNALVTIANDYERQVERSLKNLIQILEPVIILVLGLIVGFIVLSMLLPIFQMSFTVG
ncbi:MAG: type II secretion system F family protein [Candidatus Omnitrophica bacterium]|nr:type II secretion system F family protein [Candidatus Omnitrophota bacterium]